MLFPTVEYAVFFLLSLVIAWALARQLTVHKTFLLLASYLFYGLWSWHYVPLLVMLSLFAGVVAQRIQRSEDVRARKAWLAAGVTVSLLTLAYYKYTAFLMGSALTLWSMAGHSSTLDPYSPLLPLGISFFVFHAISLMADVYKRSLKEPLRMLDALLYIAFFPQLIAGPILRASRFIPQLTQRRDPRAIRVNRAFLLILAGLFKKVVLSNTLATRLVEPVFAAPQSFHALDVLLSIYGYAAQIYCDFSGYTDIAIGCALLLGYRFPRNFNAPYTASDPQEFWQRWHISLSSWLRDYLYIGLLGGNRRGRLRTYVNLMLTMLLGGLWHGASWTFVIWGGLQGIYLVVHRLWSRMESPGVARLRASVAWKWVSRILLFHAICLGWVFFRAHTFAEALMVLRQLGSRGAATLATMPVVVALVLGLGSQYRPRRWRRFVETEMARWPAVLRGVLLAAGIYVIELLGPTGVAPFIYFQF